MLIKKSVQGTNYYKNPEIEKFRYNPYRKANRKKVELLYSVKDYPNFPVHVIIETSSLCNLNCSFCNRQVMTRPQKNMDMETYKKIVDECAEHRVHSLSLYALGEPMLNPNIREMIIYAKMKGIPYVDISTNGMFDLTPLLGTGLNEVIISLDGFKNAHEKLREGANFTKIVSNLYSLKANREQGNYTTPLIRLQIIDLPETHKDIKKFIEAFKDRVDVIYVKNLEAMSQNLDDTNLDINEINKRMKKRTNCKQLFFVLTVNSNGDICYCCHDPNGKSILGNINNNTIKQCWDKLKGIRRCHMQKKYTEICKYCVDWSW